MSFLGTKEHRVSRKITAHTDRLQNSIEFRKETLWNKDLSPATHNTPQNAFSANCITSLAISFPYNSPWNHNYILDKIISLMDFHFWGIRNIQTHQPFALKRFTVLFVKSKRKEGTLLPSVSSIQSQMIYLKRSSLIPTLDFCDIQIVNIILDTNCNRQGGKVYGNQWTRHNIFPLLPQSKVRSRFYFVSVCLQSFLELLSFILIVFLFNIFSKQISILKVVQSNSRVYSMSVGRNQ